jgi:hypothetical protein
MLEHPDNTDIVWSREGEFKRKLMKDFDRTKSAWERN